MMMRSCKDHRPARTCLAAFAAAVLALSTLAPQSIAYAVEVAQNMAAGGGRALVVVEEGFDAASFSQAGLTCEALVETDGSDVSVADIQADAESEISEAAAQGDSQARDLLDTPEGAETVSAFDLAQASPTRRRMPARPSRRALPTGRALLFRASIWSRVLRSTPRRSCSAPLLSKAFCSPRRIRSSPRDRATLRMPRRRQGRRAPPRSSKKTR